MTDDMEKLDLPESANKDEEEKKESPQTVEQAFLKAINKGGQIFELDNLEITTLKNIPQFPDTTE